MPRQVLLLAGVNVGGHGKLPMAGLKQVLTDLGAAQVQTYIQSGNAVFDGTLTLEEIAQLIDTRFGFAPAGFVYAAEHFAQISAPPRAVDDPKTLHAVFHRPGAHLPDDVVAKRALDEELMPTDEVAWLYAPSGVGRSKLMAALPKALAPATARNLRTCDHLRALL